MAKQRFCPHCGAAVDATNLCATCGIVTPVDVDPRAPLPPGVKRAVRAGPAGPAGAAYQPPPPPANPVAPLVFAGMVALLVLGSVVWYKFTRPAGSGGGPTLPEEPASLEDVLRKIEQAVRAGRHKHAAKLTGYAMDMDPESMTLVRLGKLVTLLVDEESKLGLAYDHLKFIETSPNALMVAIARACRDALDRAAIGRIQAGDKAAQAGDLALAIACYGKVPAESPQSGVARQYELTVRGRLATREEERAGDELARGNLALAEKHLSAALEHARAAEQQRRLRELEKTLLLRMAADGVKLYDQGNAQAALALLKPRRAHLALDGLYRRIEKVAGLARQAEQAEAAGDAVRARDLWQEVLKAEKSPENTYRKTAMGKTGEKK